jgi:hypothetical protein
MSSEHKASAPETSQPASSVLARMIQRSREPQSSLEPVIRPRFVPRAGVLAPAGDPAPDAPPPAALPPAARPPDASPPAARPPGASPPGRRPPAAAPLGALSPDEPTPDALPSEPVTPRALAAGEISDLPEAFRVPESPPQHSLWPVTAGPGEDDIPSGDGLAPLDPVPPSRRTRAASSRPGASRAAGREHRREQPGPQPMAALADDPGHAGDAGEPSVTITIGHIEVRAVQAPPRPPRPETPPRPRPAFRPQTTLADFLGDGAARPGGSGRR